MTPEEIQEAMFQQVYYSALEIGNDCPVLPDRHEAYVQKICDALFGPEWHSYTSAEQQDKKNTVQEEYDRMPTAYLPVLRQFSRDTKEILKPDEAAIAKLCGKTSDTSDKPADEEILNGKAGESRDQAARKRMRSMYWVYEQYRPELVQRREEAPAAQCGPLDPKTIPLNEDGKTKTCPQCANKVSYNNISRHYRQTHVRDPRSAIFCPRCPPSDTLYVEWRGGSTIDKHLWAAHKTTLNKKEGKAAKAKTKGEARDKVAQTTTSKVDELEAELAGDVQGDDGIDSVDEEEEYHDTMSDE